MVQPQNRRYLTWLALGTGTMALVVAVLLVLQLTQRQAISASNELRVDSVSALAFQFEREFLRFRQALESSVNSRTPPDADTLALRYNIFISRLNLLRDNPSTTDLLQRPQYRDTLPKVDALIARTDLALANTPPQAALLAQLLTDYNTLGPDVQALSLSANSVIAETVERQKAALLQQNDHILWLTSAQLALLLAAAGALLVRQRRQERERLALEQLSDHLREAKLAADSANRSKTHFLTNMSHELRTPFNGILGMLELLDTTTLTPTQADYLKTARESARHLLGLLNDLLDVSSLESGNLSINPKPMNLHQALGDVQALMGPLAREKKLSFSMELPKTLPSWVEADSLRLKQIFINLISNSFKFTHQGGVVLRVQASAAPYPSGHWDFVVQDTGIGMDAGILGRVFERFFQADSGVSRQHGGSGLGLVLSRALARNMGGDITVSSVLGQGSDFTVRLPLAPWAPPAEKSADMAAAKPTTTPPTSPRVLVVEDHPVNSKFMGVLLQRLGCDTTFCEDGQQALALVQDSLFDLVLMDVNMPVMDGLTATRAMRALTLPMAAVPIIIVTADVHQEAREAALQAGATDFLPKPVQIAAFRELLQKHLPSLPNSTKKQA